MTGTGPGARPGEPPRGSLEPTRPTNLILAAVVAGAAGYLVMRQYFGDIPDVTWLAGITMAALAVVEGITARTTKARIDRRPRAGMLNPLLVVRLVVLAKASSLAGAIFAGAYGGVVAWALSERGRLVVADRNLAPSLAGLVGALGLVAAALLLERACRVPPEEENSAGGRESS
jgi:hypothetical protein